MRPCPSQQRSSGATAYEWAFGDGVTSTATHPAHTYTQTGSFTVVLTATAGSESDSEVKVDYVTVSAASAGELVTTTITYTYDALYHLTEADYSSGENFQYAYDAVGNMTAVTTTITSTVVSTREYDIANRLITVTADGQVRTLEWSDAGELLRDGNDTFAWDAAGRLISATVDGISNRYAYLGDGGRISVTVGGETTTLRQAQGRQYTLDLAAPLVQVLVANEGENSTVYLYGVARIGEDEGAWLYYLADHLGSVRSLVDADGDVDGAQAYRPYGLPLSSSGTASSVYGFTGEQTDPTGLVYLRARMYAAALRQFTSRDPWPGTIQRPLTLPGFNYSMDNPINLIDPSGYFSRKIIEDSLDGIPVGTAFREREGLYMLLRTAQPRDSFVGLNFNTSVSGADFGWLSEDPLGEWVVDCEAGRLAFFNSREGQKPLRTFLSAWEERAGYAARNLNAKWRESTTRYHWYFHDRNGANYFYSDFGQSTDLPDAVGYSASLWVGSFARIIDRYGNFYKAASLGLGLGFDWSMMEFEAYASLPGRFYNSVPNESQLRNIIEGPSFTLQYIAGTVAESVDIWRSGHMWAYSSQAAGFEASVSFGWTEWTGREWIFGWDWIEKIPGYDASVFAQDETRSCEGCSYEPNDCSCE